METRDRLSEALGSSVEFTDPLLSNLAFLTKFYGKPFSAHSLGAGLPLTDGLITPEQFPRAASRAGMDAKLVKHSLDNIPELLFPCILLLKEGRSCVLVDKTEAGFEVAWPELTESTDEISFEQLDQQYTGFAFYVRKRYRFDARSKQVLEHKDGHWFWSTMKRSTPIYRDALFAAVFINLLAIASPLFVMNVYDRVVPNLALDTLWVLAIGMVIVLVFDFILKETRSHLLDLAAKKSDVLLSAKIFEKILNTKLAYRPASVGAFARNVQDFDSIRDFITSATMAALVDIPFALLFIFIIMLVAGPLAIVPLVAIMIMVGYSLWVKSRIKVEVEKGARFSVQKNAHLIETLAGIESLKLASAESQFQQKWEHLIGAIANWNMNIKKYATSVGSVSGAVVQLSTIAIVIAGVYQITEGNISMGAMIAGVMLTQRCLGPFSQVSLLATRYNQAESSLKMLDELMAQPEENFDQYLHRPYFEGAIGFNQVNFKYPNSEQQVLKNINFNIKAKEKVAIIGRIGAGKTTIEKLLLGFYQPTEGAIRLDGVDINQISPADLRQKIGCLPQDVNLFYGSIRENITLGVPHVEDERILRAARQAGVTAFTDTDPEGLDRQVGERGAYLSGGQRQAVALARALLFNPPVVVLDEPTSDMDNYSEQQVKQQLAILSQEKTFVLITHKFSMLDLVDRVIVLERGSIVADGAKDSVLQALKEGKVRAPS